MRNRTVVITDASAAVARATARTFGHQGARIGLIARGRGGQETTKREVEALGGKALVPPLDVADGRRCRGAQTEGQLGRTDAWVNNAMTAVFSPVKRKQR